MNAFGAGLVAEMTPKQTLPLVSGTPRTRRTARPLRSFDEARIGRARRRAQRLVVRRDPADQPFADAKLGGGRAGVQRLAEAALGDQARARAVEQAHAGARRAEDRRGAIDGELQLLLERQLVR